MYYITFFYDKIVYLELRMTSHRDYNCKLGYEGDVYYYDTMGLLSLYCLLQHKQIFQHHCAHPNKIL